MSATVPEKAVEAGIIRDLRALGFHVTKTSQPRASMMTEGDHVKKHTQEGPQMPVRRTDSKRAVPVFAAPRTALTNHNRRGVAMATHKVGASEEWRAVEGFLGWYEVSDLGQVRSLGRVVKDARGRGQNRSGRLLTPKKTGWRNGVPRYRCVRLCKAGSETHAPVHVLVAQAFLGHRPDSEMEVNHKDGDGANNALANLEIVTREQNVQHAILTGLRPSVVNDVPAIREALRLGDRTQRQIGEQYGISSSMVSMIGSGNRYRYL